MPTFQLQQEHVTSSTVLTVVHYQTRKIMPCTVQRDNAHDTAQTPHIQNRALSDSHVKGDCATITPDERRTETLHLLAQQPRAQETLPPANPCPTTQTPILDTPVHMVQNSPTYANKLGYEREQKPIVQAKQRANSHAPPTHKTLLNCVLPTHHTARTSRTGGHSPVLQACQPGKWPRQQPKALLHSLASPWQGGIRPLVCLISLHSCEARTHTMCHSSGARATGAQTAAALPSGCCCLLCMLQRQH